MIDLSNELTVFVVSTGETTMNDCLAALGDQDCVFRIEYIQDVFPMSSDFQAMPDRCKTKYFVQVDADMLLKPHAIRTLYEAVKCSSLREYMVFGRLYEEGFGVGGAVKCWKRSYFRFFKFRDVRTVDRDLFKRTGRWGLRKKSVEGILGIHRPRFSDFSLYLKTKSDVEKWRFLGRSVDQFALGVFEEVMAEYPDSRHRVLGALLGSLTGKSRLDRSKDIQVESDRYKQVLDFLGQDGDLSEVKPIINDMMDKLRPLFSQCYGVSDNSNLRSRDDLVGAIYEIFSHKSADSETVGQFLEVVEQ